MSLDQDRADLSRFGYAQELFRSMGGFSNFAISFSMISILTGAVTLYGYGLEMGGPLEMSLGWPVATLFTMTVAASMAELCSAWPTSGAMYHWSAALGGPGWGWFTAWLNIFGGIAALAGINYSCAQFVVPFLGWNSSPLHLFLVFGAVTLTQGLLNHYGVRLVAILNDLSVTVHILGVLVMVGAILWLAPLRPVSFLATAVNSNGHAPYWWAFCLGLLQVQWTLTGYDGSAHLAEETQDPRRRAPWGIVLSVAISGLVGYLLLLALTLAIGDIPSALSAKDDGGNAIPAAIAIYAQALGARASALMGAMVSVAMWFCGLSTIASTSRALFSLARDHGTPLAGVLRRVDAVHGTPGPSIWAVVFAAIAAMAWTGALPVVTSLSTVALYVAYAIPILLGLRARPSAWTRAAVWNLGRWGPLINRVAIVYTGFICVVLVMPPNQLAGKTLASLVGGLALLWAAWVRERYRGPAWVAL